MIWTFLFGAVVVITIGYVLALLFHWIRYGATLPLVWLAMPIYLGGAGFLLLIVFTAYRGLLP